MGVAGSRRGRQRSGEKGLAPPVRPSDPAQRCNRVVHAASPQIALGAGNNETAAGVVGVLADLPRFARRYLQAAYPVIQEDISQVRNISTECGRCSLEVHIVGDGDAPSAAVVAVITVVASVPSVAVITVVTSVPSVTVVTPVTVVAFAASLSALQAAHRRNDVVQPPRSQVALGAGDYDAAAAIIDVLADLPRLPRGYHQTADPVVESERTQVRNIVAKGLGRPLKIHIVGDDDTGTAELALWRR